MEQPPERPQQGRPRVVRQPAAGSRRRASLRAQRRAAARSLCSALCARLNAHVRPLRARADLPPPRQPCVRQQQGHHPQVRPQHLPPVLPRVRQEHWLHQGAPRPRRGAAERERGGVVRRGSTRRWLRTAATGSPRWVLSLLLFAASPLADDGAGERPAGRRRACQTLALSDPRSLSPAAQNH